MQSEPMSRPWNQTWKKKMITSTVVVIQRLHMVNKTSTFSYVTW